MTSTLLVVLLFSQAVGPDTPPAGASEPLLSASQAGKWRYLARMEASGLALLPRAGVGAAEGFVQVEPTLILDDGAQFGLNLGAPVRLRLWSGGELYVPGTGGTLLFARGLGMTSPGAFACVGLGVDHAR